MTRESFASWPALCGVFVTGTDTEVGKTRISAALLHAAQTHGQRVAGYKPVASGLTVLDGRRCNEDVALLHRYSTAALGLHQAEVGPCQFETACAPHVAAALEGRGIVLDELLAGARHLARRADWLVVEGAGGWRIPFDARHDSSDLARALGLPVVLVVGLRLGCINHALLTAESIRARGLTLAGWVGNSVDADMPLRQQTVDTLRHWLQPAPCLGIVPWLPQPTPERVAAALDATALPGWPTRA